MKRKPRDHGNVLLLVVVGMVVFCGFGSLAVDTGILFVNKERAQSAVDAGALAGAAVLLQGSTSAAQTALQMAQQNDNAGAYQTNANTTTNQVQVTGQETVPLWFARIFNQNSKQLHVSATAQIGTLTSGVGIVPIAVPDQTFTFGQDVYLSEGAGGGQSGNYGFLDLSGNGASGVESDIENGYNFPLSVGEQVPTKPGVMAGPVSTAINYRLEKDANDAACNSFATVRPDCARVMYLPVVNTLAVNGKKDITILGFAAFYLEGMEGNGGHQQILGKFLQVVRPGTMGEGTNYGTFSEKLTGQ